MRSTQLKILEVTHEGCAVGYVDPNRVEVVGIISPPLDHAHSNSTEDDMRPLAEALVRSINMMPRLMKSLRDAQTALNEAITGCEVMGGFNTRRWAAASDQARYAIEDAERMINEYFAD